MRKVSLYTKFIIVYYAAGNISTVTDAT